MSDKSCDSCGREEPMGVHYIDCALLEDGDLIMPRGLTAEQERGFDGYLGSFDPGRLVEMRVTSAPLSYDGHGTFTEAYLPWRWKGGNQMRQVVILAENLDWQLDRYFSGNYACKTVEDFATMTDPILFFGVEPAPTVVIA